MRALKDTGLDLTYAASLTPHINHMLKGLMSLFTEEKATLKVIKYQQVGS